MAPAFETLLYILLCRVFVMYTARCATLECAFIAVVFLGGFLTLLQVLYVNRRWGTAIPKIADLPKKKGNPEINAPVILWWTSCFGDVGQYKNCGDKRCYFTRDRSNALHPLLNVAILFYGSNFEIGDVPIPRRENVRWALLHEESPRNNPMFVHKAALELFNYSATFSRYSDVPLTLQSLPGEKELIGKNYYLPVKEKNKLLATKKLAPVLYIQSDCDTANDRDSYVAELMKYIQVDSYGACLNNRQLPESLRVNYIDRLDDKEFLTFVAQYKFTLAFENAVCDDYITEKLWRPLIVGSVPVYYGSPTFKDWLPNNTSAIAVEDFDQPRDLAEFLLKLNNDDTRYEKYLMHKLSNPEIGITNELLLNDLRSRPDNLYSVFEYSVSAFECLVCKKLHDTKMSSKMSTKQYNCPLPENMLPSGKNRSNPWVHQWMLDKCAAKLLSQHVHNGTEIHVDRFTDEMFLMSERNDCDNAINEPVEEDSIIT